MNTKYAQSVVKPKSKQEGTPDLGRFLAGFDFARGPNTPKWMRKRWGINAK